LDATGSSFDGIDEFACSLRINPAIDKKRNHNTNKNKERSSDNCSHEFSHKK
jgi:hypothetical protein